MDEGNAWIIVAICAANCWMGFYRARFFTCLAILVIMPAHIIQRLWGGPGLLVYLLGLLAVAMFSLQRALVNALQRDDARLVWHGRRAAGLVGDRAGHRPGKSTDLRAHAGHLVDHGSAGQRCCSGGPYLPVGARFFLAPAWQLGRASWRSILFGPFRAGRRPCRCSTWGWGSYQRRARAAGNGLDFLVLGMAHPAHVGRAGSGAAGADGFFDPRRRNF